MKRSAIFVGVVLLMAFAMLSVLPGSSGAAEDGRNYLLVKLGFYSPQTDGMKDYNEGVNGEIYYGLNFHPNFAAELGAGYFKSDGPGNSSIKTFDVLYNMKARYRFGALEVFGGPGIGLYLTKGYNSFTGAESEWKPAFGYQVLAGITFDLTSKWFLGAEGKYFFARTKDPVIPQGGVFGTHLDGAVGTALIGWRF